MFIDKKTGGSKGFGFVSFDTAEAAEAAITQMDGFPVTSSVRTSVPNSKDLTYRFAATFKTHGLAGQLGPPMEVGNYTVD